MTPIPPLHHLTFPDAEQIGSVVFSPDGSVLYIQLDQFVVNLWPALVSIWPEITTVLLLLVLLALVIWAIRIARRPRRRGQPYCRRCNYHLAGLPAAAADGSSAPCPECGANLGKYRPVIARGRARRLAPVTLAALLTLAAGALLWTTSPPRSGDASQWFRCHSRWLYTHAQQRSWTWHRQHTQMRSLIIAVDPAAGTVLRTVRVHSVWNHLSLALSPDGALLFLCASPNELLVVRTTNGKVAATFRGPSPKPPVAPEQPHGWQDVLGFSHDGSTAYASHLDQHTGVSRIYACHPRSGMAEPVIERDTGLPASPGGAFLILPPSDALLAAADGTRWFVTLDTWTSRAPVIRQRSPDTHIHVHRPDGAHAWSIDLPRTLPFWGPIVSPEGVVYYGNMTAVAVDLHTGERVPLPPVHIPAGADLWPQVSPDALWYCYGWSGTLTIMHLPLERTVAHLSIPAPLMPAMPRFSQDGRWVAVVNTPVPRRLAPTPTLLIYDWAEAVRAAGLRPGTP